MVIWLTTNNYCFSEVKDEVKEIKGGVDEMKGKLEDLQGKVEDLVKGNQPGKFS